MPVNWSLYPANWKTEIRPAILERTGNCCEGSPAYPECRAENHEPHPVTGSRVVLSSATDTPMTFTETREVHG